MRCVTRQKIAMVTRRLEKQYRVICIGTGTGQILSEIKASWFPSQRSTRRRQDQIFTLRAT